MAGATATRFVVAWTLPPSLGGGDRVLSFLTPGEDARLAGVRPIESAQIESARSLAEQWRTRAFDLFVTIAVQAGLARDRRGRTLRAALQRPGMSSDWWFHRVSSRTAGNEDRTIFEGVLTALVVDAWASARGAHTLHLHGALPEVIRVLRSKYRIVATGTVMPSPRRRVRWLLDVLRERVWCVLFTWRAAGRRPRRTPEQVRAQAADERPIVAITGHSWLHWDPRTSAFVDTHFKGLDAALDARGFRVMRLLWYLSGPPGQYLTLDPDAEPYANGHAAVLQSFVTRREILREALSCGPLLVYLRWMRRRSFRAVFRTAGGLDLFPLYGSALMNGFLGGDMTLARLGAIATARACDAHRPVFTLCHWEWFFDGRAHYEGVQRARHETMPVTLQHAANTEVVFYHVDPANELAGEPDGCRPPHARHVFVMGEAGFHLFRASGYEPDALTRTGSTRFDIPSLRASVVAHRRRLAADADADADDGANAVNTTRAPLRLLVVPSSLSRDADLIEAAYAAAEDVDGIDVWVRKKPGSQASFRPSTAAIGPRLRCTDASFEEDLAAADLVLFSVSSAADQAFVCGVPVWQWLAVNLQGTLLSNAVALPRFHSVAALRDALDRFVRDPGAWQPSPTEVTRTEEQIFGRSDGQAAERIADRLRALHDERTRGARPGASGRHGLSPVTTASQHGVPA